MLADGATFVAPSSLVERWIADCSEVINWLWIFLLISLFTM